jgi:hypothetical protein
MPDQLSDRRIARVNRQTLAEIMFGGFYRCPTTGRVITALKGDDKALCPCGRSNPRVPTEETARTGVHIVRFLTAVSVGAFIDQCEADDEARRG